MSEFDPARLQSGLAKLVSTLQDDLRERCDTVGEVGQLLQSEYDQARSAQRTSEAFGAWRESYLDQVAVAWVLASLFLRYLEDNALVDEVWLSGVGARRNQAMERYSAYFRAHPEKNDRDYFQHVFDQLAQLPGCSDLFGRDKTPLWKVGLSGDGAKKLRSFWCDIDPARGALSLEGVDTRFLGDLYQNLSAEARSRYALLQTPDFVESFILDRTLEPAIREFGLDEVRLIDPTCGSGHFLLGAFERLLKHWQKKSTDNPRVLARKALDAVHGIDINPFAVAIARFRLLLAFLLACGLTRLKDMPDAHPRVATGDSLLFGREVDRHGTRWHSEWLPEPFAVGDYAEAVKILSQRYHAVVGNPPYITARDKCHNEVVRETYYSCHMKYSLGVPFTERFFDLAVAGQRAGYVGMITTNSFMKREFGKKLIEDVLPNLDLTHVLDTSAAYIPGHGTPTVILFGRHRPPVSGVVRAVLGIRGEPGTPDDPGKGLVWSSILSILDGKAGDQNAYVSVADVERTTFAKHPWSIGGGGAAELKERIEEAGVETLGGLIEEIGFLGIPNADDIFIMPRDAFSRVCPGLELNQPLTVGDEVRDWQANSRNYAFFPYSSTNFVEIRDYPSHYKWLWSYRAHLENRTTFSRRTYKEEGLPWWKWHQVCLDRLRTPLSIVFAFVGTHNHFALDRGGRVFIRTAPIIKLRVGASEEDHLALMGLLNSSTWCFWAQQTCHNKGGPGGARSKDEKWHDFYEFDGTKLRLTPVPADTEQLVPLVRELDALGTQQSQVMANLGTPTRDTLANLGAQYLSTYKKMVSLQEELDWQILNLFGLCEPELVSKSPFGCPALWPGQRAFEILAAQEKQSGELVTRWFDRPERKLTLELENEWPPDYQILVLRRLSALRNKPELRLIESFGSKRRWELEPWDIDVQRVLRAWLLDRAEATVKSCSQMVSCTRLADQLAQDADFLSVLATYKKRDDFHLPLVLTELLTSEAVPYLAAYRYSELGLRVWAEWESVWELQRRQDTGEKLDNPLPPKYASQDFRKADYWRLRGKLDVAKERFILYPGAEREADPSTVIGWAGWNHLQRATALATYLLSRKEEDGWGKERLQPLLAGLAELLPWLKQWHNEVDFETGERLGDYYESFLREEARAVGLTLEAVAAWRMPEGALRKSRAKKA